MTERNETAAPAPLGQVERGVGRQREDVGMWPFKSKAAPVKEAPVPSKWELDQTRVAALRAWRDIGQEFEYLGRRMVVCGHSRIEFSGMMLWLVPEIRARYADNAGKVHELTLSESEALALAQRVDLPLNVRAKATAAGGSPLSE